MRSDTVRSKRWKCCRFSALYMVALLGVGACENPFAGGCDTYAAPGLQVSLVDAVTGAPLPGTAGARAIAREGTFADTVPITTPQVHFVYERAGTYDVLVEYPGFETWSRSTVVVEEDRCHVKLTKLTARLVRSTAFYVRIR